MIDRDALFSSRDQWERKALGLFTTTLAEERAAVLVGDRTGFDQTRWFGALFTLWNGVADDWMPATRVMLGDTEKADAYFFLAGSGLT